MRNFYSLPKVETRGPGEAKGRRGGEPQWGRRRPSGLFDLSPSVLSEPRIPVVNTRDKSLSFFLGKEEELYKSLLEFLRRSDLLNHVERRNLRRRSRVCPPPSLPPLPLRPSPSATPLPSPVTPSSSGLLHLGRPPPASRPSLTAP